MMTGSKYYVQSKCYASTRLSELAAAQGATPPGTQYMAEGTQGHKEIETGEPEKYGEDANALVEKAGKAVASLYPDTPAKTIKEERFYLREGIEPMYSGQPDIVLFWEDHALFQDFKVAHQPEWEVWEKQLEAYAILIYEETGIDRIEGQIVPLCANVHTWHWDRNGLDRARTTLLEVISKHNEPDARTRPGDWCRFCAARLTCKDALLPNDEALTLARAEEKLPTGLDGANFVTRLRAAIGIAGEILEWYEAQLVKDPLFLGGGYVMREGAENAVITDNITAAKRLSHHLTLEEQAECIKWFPGKLRKVFQTKNKTNDVIARQMLEKILGDALTYKRNKPQMVEKTQ